MPTTRGQPAATVVRLVHCSDIHVAAPTRWRPRDWFGKRVPGWLNWRFGRNYRFRHTETILAAFARQLRQTPPDAVVFSGDATRLGFEPEFARAAELLGAADGEPLSGCAVPGNHDCYTPEATAGGWFERHFAAWQLGERVDEAVYPFARRVGHVWLIGVNSCTPNRWLHDARGAVGRAQLDRLERLLRQLPPGPRLLVTHYPFCLADGRPETRWHGLRDLADLLAVAAQGGISCWLHGHRHHPYALPQPPGLPGSVLCAGSLTQEGCASYGEYVIEGQQLRATRYSYSLTEAGFVAEEIGTWSTC